MRTGHHRVTMEQSLFDLIQKYNISGPRYTSYPPAPIFSPSFSEQDYKKEICRVERETTSDNLSLYVHIPFCDTLCYFCGCTTVITHHRSKIDEYLTYLKKEIALLSPLINEHRNVVQMHWGGGTPTSLSPQQITELGQYINSLFTFDADAEVSVEVDPRELTYEHVQALRGVGFNRMSLGVQDFNPTVQHAVNRMQSEELTKTVIAWSRSLGFRSLNIDLIYGLPLQTVESFSNTLDTVLDISPERIAVYNFAYVPWMKKHQTVIHEKDIPSPETKLGLLTTTIEKLTDAGYEYIGMDHFAKPEDEMSIARKNKTLHRNFQGYSTKANSDMYGFGMSSIGHFGNVYAQNAKTLPAYYSAIDAGDFATQAGYLMSGDDILRKYVIMRLMCDLYLDKSETGKKFSIAFDKYFEHSLESLQPLCEDGFIIDTPDSLSVTSTGRLFLRNIAMCFDRYISQNEQRQVYSRTV